MDHLYRPPLLPVHLRLQIHHRQPTPEQPLHTMRPLITQPQTTDATTGTIPQHGTTPHLSIEAIILLTVKVALEIIIAKVTPDTTIPHAIPTDPAGKHYTNEEHF